MDSGSSPATTGTSAAELAWTSSFGPAGVVAPAQATPDGKGHQDPGPHHAIALDVIQDTLAAFSAPVSPEASALQFPLPGAPSTSGQDSSEAWGLTNLQAPTEMQGMQRSGVGQLGASPLRPKQPAALNVMDESDNDGPTRPDGAYPPAQEETDAVPYSGSSHDSQTTSIAPTHEHSSGEEDDLDGAGASFSTHQESDSLDEEEGEPVDDSLGSSTIQQEQKKQHTQRGVAAAGNSVGTLSRRDYGSSAESKLTSFFKKAQSLKYGSIQKRQQSEQEQSGAAAGTSAGASIPEQPSQEGDGAEPSTSESPAAAAGSPGPLLHPRLSDLKPKALEIGSQRGHRLTYIVNNNTSSIGRDTDLHEFDLGSRPYRAGGNINGTEVIDVPEALLNQNLSMMTADINDAAVVHRSYMQLSFKCPCCVYLLLPSLMKPPKWLRANFDLVRGARVVMSWSIPLPWRTLLFLSQRLQDFEQQHMVVWQSKRIFKPGEILKLGGPEGGGNTAATNYVLLFRFDDGNLLSAAHHSKSQHFRRLMSCIERKDYDGMKQLIGEGAQGMETSQGWANMVHMALTQGEYDMVKLMVTSGFARTADEGLLKRLVRDAVMRQDFELLVAVTQHSDAELDYVALRWLIHSWNEHGPHADPERYLVEYILKKRNPLSSCSAIVCGLRQEMEENEDARASLSRYAVKFHSLHISLLRRLIVYVIGSEEERVAQGLPSLEAILEPKSREDLLGVAKGDAQSAASAQQYLGLHGRGATRIINDFSPLTVAFDLHDKKVLGTPIMTVYTNRRWRGTEFTRLSVNHDARSLNLMSASLGYTLLRSLGLAGGPGDFIIRTSMRMWHLYMFTSTPFFNSPRGRWAMQCLIEVTFMVLFECLVANDTLKVNLPLHYVYLAYVVANLMDIWFYVSNRHAKLKRYMQDPWNAFNIVTNLVLLVLFILRILQLHGYDVEVSSDKDRHGVMLGLATAAIFVWLRNLGVFVPIYPKMGALLTTATRMMSEVVAFLLPAAMILSGFATTFAALYAETDNRDFDTFWHSILNLFGGMLAQFDLSPLMEYEDRFLSTYSLVLMIIFLTISAVLLLNLLIAVMTENYKPKETAAETQFKRAAMVNYYMFSVKNNLMCSPFSLTTIPARILPSGTRKRLPARVFLKWGLPPLDGLGAEHEEAEPLPTGAGELPHLCYLLTLYPLCCATSLLLYLLHMPLSVAYFAVSGHRLFMPFVRGMPGLRETRHSQGAKHKPRLSASLRMFSTATTSMPPRGGSKDGSEEQSGLAVVLGLLVDIFLSILRFTAFALLALALYLLGAVVLLTWCIAYTWTMRILFSLYHVVRGVAKGLRACLCIGCSGSVAPLPHSGSAHHPGSGQLGQGSTALRSQKTSSGGSGPGGLGNVAAAAGAPKLNGLLARAAGASNTGSAAGGSGEHGPGLAPATRSRNDDDDEDFFIGGSLHSDDAKTRMASMRSNSRRSMIAMRWQAANNLVQETVLKKSKRYLTKDDLLLALYKSRFRPHMHKWGLNMTAPTAPAGRSLGTGDLAAEQLSVDQQASLFDRAQQESLGLEGMDMEVLDDSESSSDEAERTNMQLQTMGRQMRVLTQQLVNVRQTVSRMEKAQHAVGIVAPGRANSRSVSRANSNRPPGGFMGGAGGSFGLPRSPGAGGPLSPGSPTARALPSPPAITVLAPAPSVAAMTIVPPSPTSSAAAASAAAADGVAVAAAGSPGHGGHVRFGGGSSGPPPAAGSRPNTADQPPRLAAASMDLSQVGHLMDQQGSFAVASRVPSGILKRPDNMLLMGTGGGGPPSPLRPSPLGMDGSVSMSPSSGAAAIAAVAVPPAVAPASQAEVAQLKAMVSDLSSKMDAMVQALAKISHQAWDHQAGASHESSHAPHGPGVAHDPDAYGPRPSTVA